VNRIRWVARDLKPPVLYRAAELFRDGHTVRQVADLLGVSRSEAGRLRLKTARVTSTANLLKFG
jgi:hypothetical protein